MSHYIDILIYGVLGALGVYLAQWIKRQRLNRFKWDCPHPGCDFRFRTNHEGGFTRIVENHIQGHPDLMLLMDHDLPVVTDEELKGRMVIEMKNVVGLTHVVDDFDPLDDAPEGVSPELDPIPTVAAVQHVVRLNNGTRLCEYDEAEMTEVKLEFEDVFWPMCATCSHKLRYESGEADDE